MRNRSRQLLGRRLGILTRTIVERLLYARSGLNIQSRSLTARKFTVFTHFLLITPGFLPFIHAFNEHEAYVQCNNIWFIHVFTESYFHHSLFDLQGTRKVEIRDTNFHFSTKKVTSKSRKVEVFDLTIVKNISTPVNKYEKIL